MRPGKKTIRPLTAGTHQLHLRTQGSVSEKKTIRPRLLGPTSYTFARKEVRPDKKMIRPLTAGTHQLHLRRQGSA